MNTLKHLQTGFNGFRRVLSLWFAFQFALWLGLYAVLGMALINQPMTAGILVPPVLAIGPTLLVYRWYPDVRSEAVWSFAIMSIFISFVLLLLSPGMSEQAEIVSGQTSGSLYYSVKATLILLASLSLGYAWRRQIPELWRSL